MSFSSFEVAVGEQPDQPDPDRVGVLMATRSF
jgi:hypothetical protein